MTTSVISTAKIVLLAVSYAGQADISGLHAILSKYLRVLHTELFLRILLSHLPETLESTNYVSLLEFLVSDSTSPIPDVHIDISGLAEISDEEAEAKARKLHLLPLAWPHTPYNNPADPLLLFLFHRSLRIDKNAGFLSEIPALLTPFFQRYPILRVWMVSTILPLLRLNYEYHPLNDNDDAVNITIPMFERLDHKATVRFLLSRMENNELSDSGYTVRRDLRGLIGPWIYGETQRKKLREVQDEFSYFLPPKFQPESLSINEKYAPWEEVYRWILQQANDSWKIAVQAIEGWHGPDDYDLGDHESEVFLDEESRIYLERRYAQISLAVAYSIPEGSKSALEAIQRIIVRIISLMDQPEIPNIETACALLMPVIEINIETHSQMGSKNLKDLVDHDNPLTKPNRASIILIHTFLTSATLCGRFGCPVTIKHLAELVFHRDENMQRHLFQKIILFISSNGIEDDHSYLRIRKELLWLRSWGTAELATDTSANFGIGILGLLSKVTIEIEFLKVLLAKSRLSLAQSIYEGAPEQPLSRQALHDTIMAVAVSQYDSATNLNRSRGGLKRCDEILKAFPDTLSRSSEHSQIDQLLQLTSKIEQYRLVLKRGEPFKPVSLRVHEDPIVILGKILEQNQKSYTNITQFIEMAQLIVKAGLTKKDTKKCSKSKISGTNEELIDIERQIVSMCIDRALIEDDFETAYHYVATQLKEIGGPAQACTPDSEKNTPSQTFGAFDDWSWRAALQAGKYRLNNKTAQFTRTCSTVENQNIRHLEQCLDCLSKSLKLAPRGALQEILNVYRRCEEELENLLKEEAKEAHTWDIQADDQMMPGGFALTPAKKDTKAISGSITEEPVSLFDLSRASMLRAQNGLSAFSMLKGKSRRSEEISGVLSEKFDDHDSSTLDSTGAQTRSRKRDQLKNAAVGGLVSGVGWLIGAPAPRADDGQ
ncbi:hypothetical protein K3495_g3444 [Podosphaera aphanis]|nr:hypothetical protein K3495_g3444 [Podosphaera aphanis]